jgi:proteasome lid subunit RPN8/RPN11
MSDSISIMSWILDEIEELATMSNVEVCGLLQADTGTVADYWLLPNVHDQPRYRWAVTLEGQLNAWQQIEAEGDIVAGWFHSHVEHGPELSTEDIRMAADPGLVHLVYSVPEKRFRAWRVDRAGDAASVVSVSLEVV